MYIVLVNWKTLPALQDLMPEMNKTFTSDKFSIWGSEDKGYQFRLDGAGCEKEPRKFAELYLKKWKPKPVETEK
jgi:hypothetical protein